MEGEFLLGCKHFYFNLFFVPKICLIFIIQESSGVNFLACLLMMIFDTLLYCAIGLYFDKVCLWLCEYISSKLDYSSNRTRMEGDHSKCRPYLLAGSLHLSR